MALAYRKFKFIPRWIDIVFTYESLFDHRASQVFVQIPTIVQFFSDQNRNPNLSNILYFQK